LAVVGGAIGRAFGTLCRFMLRRTSIADRNIATCASISSSFTGRLRAAA
jgi:hypothetical protein